MNNENNDLIRRGDLRESVNAFYDNRFKGLVPNELIEYAQAVDRLIDNALTVEQFTIFCENADEKDIEDMKAELRNVLKEAKPQGYWIGKGRDSRGYCACFECSNCGAYIYPLSLEKELDYNGCPYCFADMRGDDDDI